VTLQKQNISLRVGGGMMEDVDEFLLDAPAALDLVNVRFDRQGTLSKRKPQSLLGSLLGSGVTGQALVSFNNSLVAMTADGAQSYVDSTTSWREMNERATRMSEVSSDSLIRTNGEVSSPEIAKAGDYVCVAWVDRSDDSLRYFVYHVDDPKTPRAGPTTLVTLGANVSFSLIGHGDRFVIAFADGVNIRIYINNPASNFTFALSQTIGPLAGTPTTPLLCPGSTSTHVCIAYSVTSFAFAQVNLDGSAGTSVLAAPSPAGAGPFGLAFISGSIFTGYVAVSATGEVATCTTSFSAASEVVTVPMTALDGTVYRATIAQNDATGGYVIAWSGRADDDSTNNSGALVAQMSSSHTVSRQEILPALVLVGRAISLYDATDETSGVVLPCGHIADDRYPFGVFIRPFANDASALDFAHAGTFLVDALYHQDSVQTGAGLDHRLPGHVEVDGEYWMPATVAVSDSVNVVTDGASYQGDLVRARFFEPSPTRSATAQSIRMIGGGAGVVVTDGVHVAENTPPPVGRMDCVETESGAAVPVFPDATFGRRYYKAFWRWRDAQGNVHRGPVSQEVATPFASGGSADTYKVIMRSPMPGALNGDKGTDYELEWYAVQKIADSGPSDEFTYVDTVTPLPDPDREGWMFCIIDGGDTSAVSNFVAGPTTTNSLLYTEESAGAELEPQVVPPITDITSTQSRVWILSAQDRLSVRPSKPLSANLAPEFSSELDIRIPDEGGDCVAIASLGNGIAVFKETSIYTIFGEPGSESGSGATVGVPELRVADVGCVNPLSVVEVLPLGVAFQSQDGIALLTASGEVRRIGEAVRDALGERTITSGVLIPEEGEIRWTVTNDGAATDTNTIVWNYHRDAWSRWTGFEARHSCAWRGVQARIVADGEICADSDTWTDASHAMSVTVPWLKFAGTQGLQRVHRILALMRWYTGGVTIAESIDYDDTVLHTHRWRTSDDPDFDATADPPDRDIAEIDASNARVQLSFDPLGAKCESMKLTIAEYYFEGDPEAVPPVEDPTYGRGFELIGLDVIVGMKRGNYRHKQADGGKG
jgi:hypothetical protein